LICSWKSLLRVLFLQVVEWLALVIYVWLNFLNRKDKANLYSKQGLAVIN
jgi:hypothetical protein